MIGVAGQLGDDVEAPVNSLHLGARFCVEVVAGSAAEVLDAIRYAVKRGLVDYVASDLRGGERSDDDEWAKWKSTGAAASEGPVAIEGTVVSGGENQPFHPGFLRILEELKAKISGLYVITDGKKTPVKF